MKLRINHIQAMCFYPGMKSKKMYCEQNHHREVLFGKVSGECGVLFCAACGFSLSCIRFNELFALELAMTEILYRKRRHINQDPEQKTMTQLKTQPNTFISLRCLRITQSNEQKASCVLFSLSEVKMKSAISVVLPNILPWYSRNCQKWRWLKNEYESQTEKGKKWANIIHLTTGNQCHQTRISASEKNWTNRNSLLSTTSRKINSTA